VRHGGGPERLGRAAASPDDLVAVAVDEAAAVVGFVGAHVVPLLAEADPGFVRITALGVAAPLARHGIGRRLMEMVEYVALDRGLHLLEVSSGRRPERDAAHGFYPALGFEDTAPTAVQPSVPTKIEETP
jgi:GNAT superfamily N-acetyltransferase